MDERKVSAIFARQLGLITRAQAGATNSEVHHRLRTGRWVRVGGGVYRLAGVPVTWEQRAMAACLIAGPGAVVSHRAAAVLFGISGFRPGPLEITVAPGRNNRNPIARVHRSVVEQPTKRHGVLVTNAGRTLVDLSRVVSPTLLAEAVDDVLCRRLVKLAAIAPATKPLETVFRAWEGEGEAQTVAEMKVVRALLAAGLPQPVKQYWIARAHARVDLAYPDHRIAMELDSFRWHGGRRPFHSERARGNRIVAAGWQLLRTTPGHEDGMAKAAATLLLRHVA